MEDQKNQNKTTLIELGPNLPVGVDWRGTFGKNIAVRPWRMREEKALGEIRDKNRNINVAQFTTIVLAYMCTKLGKHDFETMKLEERKVIVSQMFLPDVYYAWLFLRTQTLGPELHTKLTCPRCQSEFDFIADLNTTEVHTVDNPEKAKFNYQLMDPFEIRGKLATELIMGPARWSALENVRGGSLDTGTAKSAIIRGSIHKVIGHDELVLSPNELDDMSKRDLERLIGKLNTQSPGPDMSLESVCTSCGNKWDQDMDWGFDSFFGISSR